MKAKGVRAVGLPQQAAGQQPVGLRRRAADRIAEAGLDQALRRPRQHIEIDEHAIGRDRGQRFLVTMDGDRGIDGGIAVHRWRGGEDGAAFALPRGRIFGEIVDRARADGDIGAGFCALLHDAIRRLVVGMRAVAQPDRNRLAERCERRLDPLAQRLMRVVVREDRMRLRQVERLDELGFAAGKRRPMTTDFTGTWRRSPVSGSRQSSGEQFLQDVHRSCLDGSQHRLALITHALDTLREGLLEHRRADGEGIGARSRHRLDSLGRIDAAGDDEIAVIAEAAARCPDEIERIRLGRAVGQEIDAWTAGTHRVSAVGLDIGCRAAEFGRMARRAAGKWIIGGARQL